MSEISTINPSIWYARQERPLCMLTCYDYPTARIIADSDVDIILVGDSLGTNVLGYDSPQEVTMDDMLHHLRAVKRGCGDKPVIVDFPYKSSDTVEEALRNAYRFKDAGADMLKLEGLMIEQIEALTAAGFLICGHHGYLPQTQLKVGVQGKEADHAQRILNECRLIQKAGAQLLVLELIPAELAELITNELEIATIGIGAGVKCSGQVQVIPDLLGFTPFKIRHAKIFADAATPFKESLAAYAHAVHKAEFPERGNSAHIDLEQLQSWQLR